MAGIGGDTYRTYRDKDVWRCTEDVRIKPGGECNADLCGTCVDAMRANAATHLNTSLQRMRSPPQVFPKGRIFFKVMILLN